jgi:hypothetical protein
VSNDLVWYERLDDDAIVVRGGELGLKDVREQANDEYESSGTFSISVAGGETGWTLEQVAKAARRPNRQIRKTTAGRLRQGGFDVAPPQGERKHVNLILAEQRTLTDEDWATLSELFDVAEPNPYSLT